MTQAQVKDQRMLASLRQSNSHLRILTFAHLNVHPVLFLLPQSPLPHLLLRVRPHDNRFFAIHYILMTFDIFIYNILLAPGHCSLECHLGHIVVVTAYFFRHLLSHRIFI